MPSELRPLRLLPAPASSARALITMSHQKVHYTPHLQALFTTSLFSFLFTLSISLSPPSPVSASSCLSPISESSPNQSHGKVRLLMLLSSFIFLNNILDTFLLSLFVVPLRDSDLVSGFRAKIIKIGFWVIGISTSFGFLFLATALTISISSLFTPSGQTIARGITSAALSIFGIALSSLLITGVKTRGPRFESSCREDDIPGRRSQGNEQSSRDSSEQGKGAVPPTPGTRDEEREKEEKEMRKVSDLGVRFAWASAIGCVIKGLGVLSLVEFAGVEIAGYGGIGKDGGSFVQEVKVVSYIDSCSSSTPSNGQDLLGASRTGSIVVSPSLGLSASGSKSLTETSRKNTVIVTAVTNTTTTLSVSAEGGSGLNFLNRGGIGYIHC